MLRKTLCKSLKSLLFLALSSCAVMPPDEPLCYELTPWRAGCVRMISGEEFIIDDTHLFQGKTWWEMRNLVIAMPLSTWVELKKFIIKNCKKNQNTCQKYVSQWERSIIIIDDAYNDKGAEPVKP